VRRDRLIRCARTHGARKPLERFGAQHAEHSSWETTLNSLLSRYATPLTLGLFAVSTVSGVALFFHLAPGAFHGVHEWLSMLLLVPVALHVWKNWGPLKGYIRRGTLIWPVALTTLAGLAFVMPSLGGSTGGGPPPLRAARLMTQARLVDLAPVLRTTPDGLQERLRQQGFKVESTDDTLVAVTAPAGVPAEGVLFQLISSP
jgi:hypothetical protein